jgi:hypothetical protein
MWIGAPFWQRHSPRAVKGRSRGWPRLQGLGSRKVLHCLERGHQVSACFEPFTCIRCRHPGHRERFCRACFPVARDRSPVARIGAPVARGSSPVTCAPRQRSRSPSVQPRTSLTRSWTEVVGHSLLRMSVPPWSQSGCYKDSNVNAFFVSALESQFARLHTELLQKVELLRTELHEALLPNFRLRRLCLCCLSSRLVPLRRLNASLEIFLLVLCMQRRLSGGARSSPRSGLQFCRLCLSYRSFVGNHLWCYRWS